ncbi:MAG: hypothetical protein WED34_15260 [Planctomycetales bacterium]
MPIRFRKRRKIFIDISCLPGLTAEPLVLGFFEEHEPFAFEFDSLESNHRSVLIGPVSMADALDRHIISVDAELHAIIAGSKVTVAMT